jgi:hypothetical protein
MRRSRLERAFAAVLLLWFACMSGAPAALHSCPMHDAALASAGSLDLAATHVGGPHDAHAHHLPRRDNDHRACTCIGDCCANGLAPGLPAARVVLLEGSDGTARPPLPPPDSRALAAPEFLLPYANGPPGPARVA